MRRTAVPRGHLRAHISNKRISQEFLDWEVLMSHKNGTRSKVGGWIQRRSLLLCSLSFMTGVEARVDAAQTA